MIYASLKACASTIFKIDVIVFSPSERKKKIESDVINYHSVVIELDCRVKRRLFDFQWNLVVQLAFRIFFFSRIKKALNFLKKNRRYRTKKGQTNHYQSKESKYKSIESIKNKSQNIHQQKKRPKWFENHRFDSFFFITSKRERKRKNDFFVRNKEISFNP